MTVANELAVSTVNIIPVFNGGRGGGTAFAREVDQVAAQIGARAGARLGNSLTAATQASAAQFGEQLGAAAQTAGVDAGRRAGTGLVSAMGSTVAGAGGAVAAALSSSVTPAVERAGSEAGRRYAARMATSMGMLSGSQRTAFEAQMARQFDTTAVPNLFAAMNPAIGVEGSKAAATWSQRFKQGTSAALAGLTGATAANMGSQLSSAGMGLTTAVTLPLAAIGVGSTRAAMSFESAFAGVVKTVGGTVAQLDELRAGIRQMAQEIPASHDEIARVAEAAGQLGIAVPNILTFTRTMIDLSEATNLASDQAATAFARFANITQMPQTEFGRLGSTVVELGNNLATTESEIAEFALRVAGAGQQVGLTEAQILSVAAALSSVGVEAEMGGSSISRVMLDMSNAVAVGAEEAEKFARVAGMPVEQFKEMFDADAAGAVVAFVEGLDRISESGGNVAAVLDDVGFGEIRVRDTLLRAAGAGDLLRESLEMGTRAWDENIALTKEAEARYATSESQMRVFRNQLRDVAITLGDALLPALVSGANAMRPILSAVEMAASVFAALPGPVQTVVVALAAFAALSGPVAYMAGNLVTSVTGIASAFTQARAAGAGSWAATVSGFGAVGGAAAAATVAVVGFTAAARENARQLGEGIESRALKTEDILPAFNPEDVKGQTLAIEGLAYSLSGLHEVGTLSATDSILNFLGLYDDTGNRLALAEADIESFKSVLASMPVDASVAADAISRIEQSLIRQGLSAETAAEKVAPLRDALADKEVADRATDGINRHAQSVDGMGDSYDDASRSAAGLESATSALARRQALATLAFDSAQAAVAGYVDAVERSTRADDLASASIGAGRALLGLREGLKAQTSETEEAETATDALEAAVDRLGRAAGFADPKMSTLGIRLGSMSAAADAFTESLRSSSFLDDQLGAATSLGSAFRDFSRTFRRLPADIDLTAASMGRYRRRQSEAVDNTVALGNAATEYLSTLIRSGKTHDEVRGEAARLRGEYEAMFRRMGLNTEQVAAYVEVLNLTPTQVDTALRVSGLESARFRVNAYLQLLEGKIPAGVATTVTAAIERGDLEGAARSLAQFAATNPVDIAVNPEVDESKVEEAKAKLEPLREFDPLDAMLGRYSEGQYAFLSQLEAFGDEATRVIGEVFADSKNRDSAIAAGAMLRGALEGELRGLGIPDETIAKLTEQVGLTEAQITIGIDEASFAATTFKVNAILSLLDQDLTPEERWKIGVELTDDDATNDLNTLQTALQRLADQPTPHEIQIKADLTAQLGGTMAGWMLGLGGADPTATVPVDADLAPARAGVENWRSNLERELTKTGVDADTTAAEFGYGMWKAGVERTPVTADLAIDFTDAIIGLQTFRKIAERDLDLRGQTFITGQRVNPIPRRAQGGPVTAGHPYIVGEKRPELFVPDRSGYVVPSLDGLDGGEPAEQRPITFAPVYTRVEKAPTARDLVRGLRTEMFLLDDEVFA